MKRLKKFQNTSIKKTKLNSVFGGKRVKTERDSHAQGCEDYFEDDNDNGKLDPDKGECVVLINCEY